MKIKQEKLTTEAMNFMRPDSVKGGWLYRCDGMPTLRGCMQEVVVTRRFTRTGIKGTGWLVCFGTLDTEDTKDPDVGLTFCPSCAEVVLSQ